MSHESEYEQQSQKKRYLLKLCLILGASLLASFVVILFWLALWVTKVEKYEMGYVFNKKTGQVERLEHGGWVVRGPLWYDVYKLDLRPGQVCMNANQRVLNCKLVKFNPGGFDTFIEWHGPGAGQDNGIYEILRSYAFNVNNGRDCPFLTIMDDMRLKDVQSTSAPTPATTQ